MSQGKIDSIRQVQSSPLTDTLSGPNYYVPQYKLKEMQDLFQRRELAKKPGILDQLTKRLKDLLGKREGQLLENPSIELPQEQSKPKLAVEPELETGPTPKRLYTNEEKLQNFGQSVRDLKERKPLTAAKSREATVQTAPMPREVKETNQLGNLVDSLNEPTTTPIDTDKVSEINRSVLSVRDETQGIAEYLASPFSRLTKGGTSLDAISSKRGYENFWDNVKDFYQNGFSEIGSSIHETILKPTKQRLISAWQPFNRLTDGGTSLEAITDTSGRGYINFYNNCKDFYHNSLPEIGNNINENILLPTKQTAIDIKNAGVEYASDAWGWCTRQVGYGKTESSEPAKKE